MNYFAYYWNWGNLILGVSFGTIAYPGDWHITFHLFFLTVAIGNIKDGPL